MGSNYSASCLHCLLPFVVLKLISKNMLVVVLCFVTLSFNALALEFHFIVLLLLNRINLMFIRIFLFDTNLYLGLKFLLLGGECRKHGKKTRSWICLLNCYLIKYIITPL